MDLKEAIYGRRAVRDFTAEHRDPAPQKYPDQVEHQRGHKP